MTARAFWPGSITRNAIAPSNSGAKALLYLAAVTSPQPYSRSASWGALSLGNLLDSLNHYRIFNELRPDSIGSVRQL